MPRRRGTSSRVRTANHLRLFNCWKQSDRSKGKGMKARNRHELSAEQKEFVRNVVSDPVLFATHILGISLWDREAKILQSIRTNGRTAVKACHGVGKTFTLAVAALWWLARYPEGIVLTTSPTQRQVRTTVVVRDPSSGRARQSPVSAP